MSIVVQNLTKQYGEQKAIDSISFKVEAGEIVGFLGPNGAGKSTTMKILCGYLSQSEGSAAVLGIDVTKEPLLVKQKIGYLPELNPLYNEMYVKEYLHFNAGIYNIKNATEQVNRVIETAGLTLEKKKKIGQLSKGYKQRVGIAQAILHNPDVFILDEPTSGLDPNQMQEIRKLILSLGKDKTILLSSHIMQEVEAMCNRVIIINKGKIVADDNTEHIKKHLNNNTTTMSVRFRDVVDINQLKNIDGIIKVNEGVNGLLNVSSLDEANLPELLFNYAIQQNTIILEQKEVSESLESVFQQLTSNNV